MDVSDVKSTNLETEISVKKNRELVRKICSILCLSDLVPEELKAGIAKRLNDLHSNNVASGVKNASS